MQFGIESKKMTGPMKKNQFEGGKTPLVVLVDDEEAILKALGRLLRNENCHLLYASDGFEALDILGRCAQGVSMIITDQQMPQMGGLHILEKAQEICPHAKRVLITGYTEMKVIREGLKRGIIHQYFIKPWDDEILLRFIRENMLLSRTRGHVGDQGKGEFS